MFLVNTLIYAETVNEAITKAKSEIQKGQLESATKIMAKAVKDNPNSSDAEAEYGICLSQLAGKSNFLKAGMLSQKAFSHLNKALNLNPNNVNARLYRGILGVNVPKFMGKLSQAISDLEYIKLHFGQNKHIYLVSEYYLSLGYLKNNQTEKAKKGFKFIVLYGKDSQYYDSAKKEFNKLDKEKKDIESTNHYEKAMNYLEQKKYRESVKEFEFAAKNDPDNLQLHLLYAKALGNLASEGYDDTISKDVTDRASIAHDVYKVLSHCVELAPKNDNIRLLRASVGVNLPFFVNCLDEVTKDLEYLSKNGKTDKIKSEASYHLKKANEMKKVYDLAEKGFKTKSPAKRKKMLSKFIAVADIVKPKKPKGQSLEIDLKLGYRDQIAPQTAVWIEDENGNYLKTIYISGFAAHVKETQMNLPRWAEKSKFRDIETVTGASINCGEHKFYWDFTNFNGKKINPKKFVVKAEICHWPHVQYLNQSLKINLLKGKRFHSEGDSWLIPELDAKLISN